MTTFYTYVLKDPRSLEPIYVGKGCGRRMYTHWEEMLKGRPAYNPKLRAKLRSICRDGYQPIYEIALTSTNEYECFAFECDLIEFYGRENLCNLTDGGEGISGFIRPPDETLDVLLTWSLGLRQRVDPKTLRIYIWDKRLDLLTTTKKWRTNKLDEMKRAVLGP
jgi:hypothetical protein